MVRHASTGVSTIGQDLKKRDRQMLTLEDVTAEDLKAMLAVEPSPAAAALDHEVTRRACLGGTDDTLINRQAPVRRYTLGPQAPPGGGLTAGDRSGSERRGVRVR